MNIHEYQGKNILKQNGIPVLEGYVSSSGSQTFEIVSKMNNPSGIFVVKAQVHAGGRGKAGFIKLVKSKEEAKDVTERFIGSLMVNEQTGSEGKKVEKVYIEAPCNIAHEYYICFVFDRENYGITIMASKEGGMDIEEVAERTPEKILKVTVDPIIGLQQFHLRRISFFLEFDKDQQKKFAPILEKLYKVFITKDATQLEINPFVLTKENDFYPLDMKFNLDDNGIFRHPDIASCYDPSQEDEREVEAKKYDLSYVKMDGNIGCMVNGAGLAMATMDIINLHGGSPANFLDVGGGATEEKVEQAFRIILSDKSVNGIFVNIFGGIMRCDIIANGIVNAARNISINIPVVVRLQGTNRDLGKKILDESGLNLLFVGDFNEAAKTIVNSVK